MAHQMIPNIEDSAQALSAIVNGADANPSSNKETKETDNGVTALNITKSDQQNKESRLKEKLEENKAIKDGLESAKKVASQSSVALAGISETLKQVRNLARESVQLRPSENSNDHSRKLSDLTKAIDRLAEQVRVPVVEASGRIETETFEVGQVSSKDLGLSNQRLDSSEGSRDTEETATKALSEIQLKKAATSGLVNHLESQLVNLDESIVSGTKVLSSITDGNLLIRTSEASQIDSALHTSVMVQQEALQQNRWVGRALDQLQ
jgi:seryl-tRNA synthetase